MTRKLLTVALAKKMFTTLPKTVVAKVGQTIRPERVKILKIDPDGYCTVKYNRIKGKFPWYVYKKRLAVGSGADPIYIFDTK